MIIGMIIAGAMLIVAGLRGTEHELGQQLMTDLVGTGGFISWLIAILMIGAIGLIPMFHTASKYLLLLLFVVLVVQNHQVFEQAQTALQTVVKLGPAPAVQAPNPVTPSSGSSGSSSSSNPLGQVAQAAGAVAAIASFF